MGVPREGGDPFFDRSIGTTMGPGLRRECDFWVLSIYPALFRRPARCGGAVFLDAALHFRFEMPDEALHRPYRAIGQGTDRVAFDLARHLVEHVDLLDAGLSLDHPLHDPPHPAEALAARRALAAALVLIKL